MDNLAEHGIAGMVGLAFNGLFAADYIIGLDGVSTGLINGGWLNHNYKQLYIQVAYIVACTAYSFVVSALIATLINLVPGLHLRAPEEAELLGMDDDQLGEFAYDYVEVRRDYLAWTPATDTPETDGKEGTIQNGAHTPPLSQVVNGQTPDVDVTVNHHSSHTGIQGDRHGIALENMRKAA